MRTCKHRASGTEGSSKIQDPRSREDPTSKIQRTSAGFGPRSSYEASPADPLTLKEEGGTPPSALHAFDLLERTAVFGERIVQFTKRIPRNPANDRLIDQLVGCGTSIGANYCEANEGVSKKDFRHPISRCMKEAKETKFFLSMIVAAEPQVTEQARALYREANELLLIFASMFRK